MCPAWTPDSHLEAKESGASGVCVSAIPLSAEEALSAPAHAEEWRRKVSGMTVRALREKYPGEATTHARILASAKRGECEVHLDFRSLKTFLLHVGPKGDPSRTLDRRDPTDPEYAPGKVRWATPREQANNRSCTITLRGPDGRVLPLTEWAKITGQNPDTMRKRLARGGWMEEEIVAGKRGASNARPAAPTVTATRTSNPHPGGASGRQLNGVTGEKLESAYQEFCRRLPGTLKPAATRAAFWEVITACASREQLDTAEREMQASFPGFVFSEDPEPCEVKAHPAWRTGMRALHGLLDAESALRGLPAGFDLLHALTADPHGLMQSVRRKLGWVTPEAPSSQA